MPVMGGLDATGLIRQLENDLVNKLENKLKGEGEGEVAPVGRRKVTKNQHQHQHQHQHQEESAKSKGKASNQSESIIMIKRLKIIAHTANATSAFLTKCVAAGMDDYICKPCSRYKCRV